MQQKLYLRAFFALPKPKHRKNNVELAVYQTHLAESPSCFSSNIELYPFKKLKVGRDS